MRKMESSIVIQKGLRETWTRISQPECWRELTEAFSGRRMRYSVADGTGTLGVGTEVDVTTPGGRPVMRWRITEWAPTKSFELSVDESGRWLTPFHMLLRFQLEELDPTATRVTMSLVIIYLNRLVEILSLVLPVGFMYARGLRRSLTLLRDR